MASKRGNGMEITEYAQMMRRMVRGYERRLADSDPSNIMAAIEIANEMNEAVGRAVRQMREVQGFSWAEVAEYTGTTRQAAQQRWGKAKG